MISGLKATKFQRWIFFPTSYRIARKQGFIDSVSLPLGPLDGIEEKGNVSFVAEFIPAIGLAENSRINCENGS